MIILFFPKKAKKGKTYGSNGQNADNDANDDDRNRDNKVASMSMAKSVMVRSPNTLRTTSITLQRTHSEEDLDVVKKNKCL